MVILALNHPSKFTSFAWYEWWPPTRSILFGLHELSFTLHTCICIDTVAKGTAASAAIKCFGTFTGLSPSQTFSCRSNADHLRFTYGYFTPQQIPTSCWRCCRSRGPLRFCACSSRRSTHEHRTTSFSSHSKDF